MNSSFAPGKIILAGEYAVVFGYAGIAVPSSIGVEVVFEEGSPSEGVETCWEGDERVRDYLEKIVALCKKHSDARGRLNVQSNLPIGKGMGSSTAFVVAVTRVLIGENAREVALQIEDGLNPGHSGLDFATICGGMPVLFRKGEIPKPIELSPEILREAVLIDTGSPTESTPELVKWMRGRESEVAVALKAIGECTLRLASGEPLSEVMRDHHRAQVTLGVVPPRVQELISTIEQGGAAKITGAGGRTGGGGMVLALGDTAQIITTATKFNFPTMQL